MTSCVSQLFKEPNPTFSSDISYQAPDSPFFKIENSVFPSWKNKTTNNVISILSDCNNQSQSLKQALTLISSSIDGATIKEEKKTTLKGKMALFQKNQGEIDGSEIIVHSISFKNNNCYFVSSISGAPDKINIDLKSWDKFNLSLEFKK